MTPSCGSNPGHIGWRRVLSPLRHAYSPRDFFQSKLLGIVPSSRAFLSGKSFSMHNVVRVSGISRSWFVNKPAARNTRDANDIVHAKGLARKKRSASRALLQLNLN